MVTSVNYGGLTSTRKKTEFITCSDDKTLCLWDVRHCMLLKRRKLKASARAVAYAPDAAHVAVGLITGEVHVFDGSISNQIATIPVCTDWIEDLKYSPDKLKLAVTSHDNRIYIYDRKKYMQLAVLKGHSSYITHIDFSADSRYLQSNCGAGELLFWDVQRAKREPHSSRLRDVDWDSWTCVLGWPVRGIWAPGTDITDVNAVDRDAAHNLLVTGDDFSSVNLYRYPAFAQRAKHKSFVGHSSFVTNVRFLQPKAQSRDELCVVSAGGADNCIFQWRVVKRRSSRRRRPTGEQKTDDDDDVPRAPEARRKALAVAARRRAGKPRTRKVRVLNSESKSSRSRRISSRSRNRRMGRRGRR